MTVELTSVVIFGNSCQYCFKHLHKHGAQFEEVIVFWVLYFYHSPGVQTPSDLLSFHFNQLIGANHSKGNAGLKQKIWNKILEAGMEKRMENMSDVCFCISCISHLQDPGLFFELFVLVRVGIGQLVNSDPVLCNLIQDLMERTKAGWNDGGDDLTVTSCVMFY